MTASRATCSEPLVSPVRVPYHRGGSGSSLDHSGRSRPPSWCSSAHPSSIRRRTAHRSRSGKASIRIPSAAREGVSATGWKRTCLLGSGLRTANPAAFRTRYHARSFSQVRSRGGEPTTKSRMGGSAHAQFIPQQVHADLPLSLPHELTHGVQVRLPFLLYLRRGRHDARFRWQGVVPVQQLRAVSGPRYRAPHERLHAGACQADRLPGYSEGIPLGEVPNQLPHTLEFVHIAHLVRRFHACTVPAGTHASTLASNYRQGYRRFASAPAAAPAPRRSARNRRNRKRQHPLW